MIYQRQTKRLAVAIGLLFMLLGLVLNPALAREPDASWPTTWLSKGLIEHPLAGQIYAPKTADYIQPAAYLRSLAWPRFVLLGEIHDNPDHHVLQALALRFISGGDKLSVVFEHFRTDQQSVITAFQAGDQWMKSAGGDDQIARLFAITNWDKSGWPDQTIFRPLIKAVLARNAKVLAGNPPRKKTFDVARRGTAALDRDVQQRLKLDQPLGADQNGKGDLDEALLVQLEGSHCGLMPKSAFTNMAVAQRFRDGEMARVMVEAVTQNGPAALVAGNGHVRIDRGVPWYIRKMLPDRAKRPLISVGHVEVVEGKTKPTDYADAIQAYSIVVFTPRVVRPDPCEAMRKRFGKSKR